MVIICTDGLSNKGLGSIDSDVEKASLFYQAIGQQAQAISDKYAPEINRVGQLGAGAVAGNLSTGSNVVGSGNANLASQATSARIQALQNAQSSELQDFVNLNSHLHLSSDDFIL